MSRYMCQQMGQLQPKKGESLGKNCSGQHMFQSFLKLKNKIFNICN